VFCNPGGSGTGQFSRGLGLGEQWDILTARLGRKYKTSLFLAYLQSYSNTYCSAERLGEVLEEIRPLRGRVGLCIGTRPDCLDHEKLALLAGAGLGELWLELGLQSCNDATLRGINRGHDSSCFKRACEAAAKRSIKVCAHVIAGLPGEGEEDFLRTVDYLNALPVAGVKFHNVYVCKGTALARMWKNAEFEPPAMEDYVKWLCRALSRLRPDVVVHRLASDPAPGELLAPEWAGKKTHVLRLLHEELENRRIRQGREFSERA
jgi:radical SAM protein (TIGR01212 family)